MSDTTRKPCDVSHEWRLIVHPGDQFPDRPPWSVECTRCGHKDALVARVEHAETHLGMYHAMHKDLRKIQARLHAEVLPTVRGWLSDFYADEASKAEPSGVRQGMLLSQGMMLGVLYAIESALRECFGPVSEEEIKAAQGPCQPPKSPAPPT